MRIIDRYRQQEAVHAYEGVLLNPEGLPKVIYRPVLVEHSVKIYLNGEPTLRMVCTPEHLVDLAIGHLYTEGIIEGVDDVDEVLVNEEGTCVSVHLSCVRSDFSHYGKKLMRVDTTGNDPHDFCSVEAKVPDKVKPIEWEASWVFTAAQMFAYDSPLHRSTTGTHSCYVMLDGVVVACCEDLGRHNAFDKAVGVALCKGVDLKRTLVYSSGRLPVDMVMKAIRAGIPVLVTKAVPTDETIRLAQKFDLTLVCQARPDQAIVYNDPRAF